MAQHDIDHSACIDLLREFNRLSDQRYDLQRLLIIYRVCTVFSLILAITALAILFFSK